MLLSFVLSSFLVLVNGPDVEQRLSRFPGCSHVNPISDAATYRGEKPRWRVDLKEGPFTDTVRVYRDGKIVASDWFFNPRKAVKFACDSVIP